MLRAVSESIRVSRRRFSRSLTHKNIRSHTCSALHAVEVRHENQSRPADHQVQGEPSNSRQTYPEAAGTSFPFYAHSYTPEASTSKASLPAPPSISLEQQAKADHNLSKCQRRARRYVEKIVRIIENISKLHLSVPGQVQFVELLLSRLSKTIPQSDDGHSSIPAALELTRVSDIVAHWIQSISSDALALHRSSVSRVATLMITLLHRTSTSRDHQHANLGQTADTDKRDAYEPLRHGRKRSSSLYDDVQSGQIRQTTNRIKRNEATSFLDKISSTLTDAELYSCLSALTSDEWLQISPGTVARIATAVLRDNSAAREVRQAMPGRSGYHRPAPTSETRLYQLHRSMFEEHIQADPGTSRMFGPGPSKQSVFHGMKFVFSSTVLASFPSSKIPRVKQTGQDDALAVLQDFRKLFLPPDRQIMAASLHLASFAEQEVLRKMQASGVFGWLWQEWNVLRENEPNSKTDDVLLTAFLEAAGRCAAVTRWQLQPVEDDSHELAPLWAYQVFDMAQSKIATASSMPMTTASYQIQEDISAEVNTRMFRALAVAAIHLGQYQTAFTSILDPRLPARHIVPVLGALSAHLQGLGTGENRDLFRALVKISSEHLVSLASRIPRSMSASHARQLASFIELLICKGHIAAAEAFLNVPTSVLAFGQETTRRLFILLSRGSGTGLLRKLYQQLPHEAWSSQHLEVFLSCRSHWLSDTVWEHVRTRSDMIEQRLLEARLRHHLRSRQLRYSLCLQEFETVAGNSSKPLSEATRLILLDIHIRAGSGRRALQLYHELYNDAAADTPGWKLRFLKIAGLPLWSKYRRRGLKSQLSRLNGHLDELASKNAELDSASALYLAQQSLRWAEINDEAIWGILKSGMSNAKNLDWHRELKPLFTSVKLAFRRRGKYEAARQVVDMMIKFEKEVTVKRGRAV